MPPQQQNMFQAEARLLDFITPAIDKMASKSKSGFRKLEKSARKAALIIKNVFKDAGKSIADFAKRFGPTAIAIGLTTKAIMLLGQAIEFAKTKAIEFEKTMSKVKAIITGDNVKAFQKLSKEARRLGETTVFSATESGQAFVEMGKLGFKTGEIIASTADVLALAAASSTDLAQASAVVVKTLNQFNLESDQAGRLTDVMASSFINSALDIDKFQESMKFAGLSARLAGLTFEETTAILAIMADNNLDASIAGTSLNQMLIQLVKPGSKANQVFKRFGLESATVIEKMKFLASSGIDVGEVFELLDVRAGRAANVLFENIDVLENMAEGFKDVEGEAQRMADTMLDNVAGAQKILESVSEGLAIALGEAFGSDKRTRIELYTEAIQNATKWVRDHQKEIKKVSALLSGILTTSFTIAIETVGAFANGLDRVNRILDRIRGGVNEAKKQMELFNTAIDDRDSLERLIELRRRFDDIQESGKAVTERTGIFGNIIRTINPELEKINARVKAIAGASFEEAKGQELTLQFLEKRAGAIDKVKIAQDLLNNAQKTVKPTPTPIDLGAPPKEDATLKKARLDAEREIKRLAKEADRVSEEEFTEFMAQTHEGRLQLLENELIEKSVLLKQHGQSTKALEDNITRKIQEENIKRNKSNEELRKKDSDRELRKRREKIATNQMLVGSISNLAQAITTSEKMQQRIALISSIIQGALAIQKAVASAAPPLNLPAIIATSALAAANTATIARQAFVHGGFPHGRNANIRVNERGQEAVLNAGAVRDIGVGNINAMNSGQGLNKSIVNEITYAPTINVTGDTPKDFLDVLREDKEGFSDLIRDVKDRGFLE